MSVAPATAKRHIENFAAVLDFAVEKPRKNNFKAWGDLLVRFMEYLRLDGAPAGAAR